MARRVENKPSTFGIQSKSSALLGLCLTLLLALSPAPATSLHRAPLYDPVTLQAGFLCHWEHRCMAAQFKANVSAHRFTQRKKPRPTKRRLCTRNAGRAHRRIDWVGFNNCIHNRAI